MDAIRDSVIVKVVLIAFTSRVRELSLRVVLFTTSESCRCVSCSVLRQSVVAACRALYYVRVLSLHVVLCTTSECCRCVSCSVLRQSVVAACRALYYVRVLSLRVVLCTTSESCRCVSCSVLRQSVVAACRTVYYAIRLMFSQRLHGMQTIIVTHYCACVKRH